MKNTTQNTLIKASIAGAAILTLASTAFAQVGATVNVNASANITTGSSTKPHGTRETPEQRMQGMQDRGGKEIDARITSLNNLLTRIQAMKNVSDAQKASFAASIQAEITTLTNLKIQIGGDTSTTTLKSDVQSITKAYRIYALVMPQTAIAAAADRVGTIAGMLTTVSGKLQSRLAADATLSANASLQADLTDMNAKIADANVQAQAAVSEVASLKPDNGDKTIMASNTAALKDARTKLQAATKDLQAARKDAQTIIQALKKADGEILNATSTKI